MKKLRMLIFLGVYISSQAQVCLPNEVIWLEWPNAPNLEFGSGPNKLVRLDVPKSHIRQLGGNSQKFRQLKFIHFHKCKSLVSIHDLSSAPNMEKMILNGCESLVEVHQSVGNLGKLKVLSLESCSNLSNFPNTLRTKSLEALILSGCSKFEKFPDIDGKMKHLGGELPLCSTAIKELPTSIENLVFLGSLNLAFCKDLVRLPVHIYKLRNLFYLNLDGCSNLITFPRNMEDSIDPNGHLGFRNLGCLSLRGCNLSELEFLESSSSFSKLWFLDLSYNKFTHLPACIKYHHFSELIVEGCELLQEIPQLPSSVCKLLAPCCESLRKLPDLFGGSPFHSLEVDLTSCCELFREGVDVDDVANLSLLKNLPKISWVDIVLIGREMPKWILPCEEHSIFFMVPRDLYGKLKGLALCIVLSLEEGKVVNVSCDFTILVNGKSVKVRRKDFSSKESDHVWLYYCSLGVQKLLRNDWSHFQVCIRVKKGSIKKCGFRLICEQKKDDLRVVFPAPSADKNEVKVLGKTQKKIIQ